MHGHFAAEPRPACIAANESTMGVGSGYPAGLSLSYRRALQGLRAALASRKEELILSGFATAILLVLSSTKQPSASHYDP
jgi:hypothetical protein